ncbi:hypothetical protein KIL84_009119 [Mauremys mutica]|uniref:Uncharacterized protein n=1 Tax=Mauremys mutica TaxID=74926 RepID=A0A9D4B3N0_9SAUR|nr:hypothetical protein KIL84_009119 [Mauremys mutica]
MAGIPPPTPQTAGQPLGVLAAGSVKPERDKLGHKQPETRLQAPSVTSQARSLQGTSDSAHPWKVPSGQAQALPALTATGQPLQTGPVTAPPAPSALPRPKTAPLGLPTASAGQGRGAVLGAVTCSDSPVPRNTGLAAHTQTSDPSRLVPASLSSQRYLAQVPPTAVRCVLLSPALAARRGAPMQGERCA